MAAGGDIRDMSKVTIPRVDGSFMNSESLINLNLPKQESNNGHPRYDFEYSWRSMLERLNVMNDLIEDFEDSFNSLQGYVATVEPGDRSAIEFRRYQIRGEILAGALKATADQFLSLLSILESRADSGYYTDKIARDHIGSYLNGSRLSEGTLAFMQKHAFILRELNDAANGSKHSFLNLHVSAYMTIPSVLIYHLPQNDQSKEGSPVTIVFEEAIPSTTVF